MASTTRDHVTADSTGSSHAHRGEVSAETMQVISQDEYGPPTVLERREVPVPAPTADQILVRVRAAAANPLDWHMMRGEPYLMRLQSGLRRPSTPVRGVDVAGVVEAVGPNVTEFQPGDEVFGQAAGAFAEYVVGRVDTFAAKPSTCSFEEAAAVPVAATTALQGLRDHGELTAGQTVLINGASGGVGTFAVQLAKSFGAEVTGVCSTRNVELVRSLGTDHVVDYTKTDFTTGEQRYDLVFDLAGNHSLSALRRVLTDEGTLVLCSGAGGRLLGPLGTLAWATVVGRFSRQRLRGFLATVNTGDLETLAELLADGTVTPTIDRTYPLAETPEAIRYLETGHARGKVVITV
ncbi:NAD(P)-dependent alcohol dehydrogenase [Haloarchaeobius sp. DYHT-AS-18]|uniref:NAD(P)-dependent alcohol dehydrogenase n=1 Tax=Haloarchaeobius sp. DYHT-AS-18 TaxID=3446117 RepID=UPI003EB83145